MNDIIQTILTFSAVAIALLFLIKKFFWSKTSSKKACSKDSCGCN